MEKLQSDTRPLFQYFGAMLPGPGAPRNRPLKTARLNPLKIGPYVSVKAPAVSPA
jgi:hypothetical protein